MMSPIVPPGGTYKGLWVTRLQAAWSQKLSKVMQAYAALGSLHLGKIETANITLPHVKSETSIGSWALLWLKRL